MPIPSQIAGRLSLDEGELVGALLASMVDAVYAVDGDGVVLFANPAAVQILGYASEAELIGRPSHATIHARYPDGRPFPEADCPLLRPRRTGEAVRVDQDWFIRRDGSFVPVAYSSAPVSFAERRGAVVVFRDISERNRAEAERLRAEAIHASRARIVQAALDERRRLGRDLHDGAQQRLINVIFALQAAARGGEDGRARAAIAEALEETQLAIRDLRDLGAGLDPSVLAHRGLAAAITSLTARTPVPVSLDLPSERFAPLVESTAYFIVSEALANVAKHANASEAAVMIAAIDGRLTVTVTDDGRGGAGAELDGGSGLAGLADRVAAVGGTLTVDSAPSAGTRVVAELPLPDGVSERGAG
ncbi:MAG TPA: PAS domain-containing sensor histidine kinase [Solirubrobacteraceae bacterium]|jgi:PAS domain S-box-containing protein|nr:PAS domain-containing sensor histidine kinase [Solirubrobacteraceae bacterium]